MALHRAGGSRRSQIRGKSREFFVEQAESRRRINRVADEEADKAADREAGKEQVGK